MTNCVDLSILMPTHNRPSLFSRALNSVIIPDKKQSIEIIVNNDTSDITEISSDIPITYMYEKFDDLSKVYETLLSQARGKMVFFLEDDDYLLPGFFDYLYTSEFDFYFIEYTSKPLLRELTLKQYLDRMTVNRSVNTTLPSDFIREGNFRDYQLSQIIFNPSRVSEFPRGDDINNDYTLLCNIAKNSGTFKYLKGAKWVQTVDAGDNISFDN